MKKSLIGIAILLFAILLQQCSAGMEIFTLTIGLVGLTITIFMELSQTRENRNL